MASHASGGGSSFVRRRALLEAVGWDAHAIVARRLDDTRSILDVACGDGKFLGGLPPRGERVGVDRDHHAVEEARARHPHLEWHVREAGELPLDDRRFEVLTCLQALPHMADPAEALRACRRAMAPGATLWVTSNASRHLAEFWHGVREATKAHPDLAPLFEPPPSQDTADTLEARLERTLGGVFGNVRVDLVSRTLRLSAEEALELLDSYREAFRCSEPAWQTARHAVRSWLGETVGTQPWAVTGCLVLASAVEEGR